MPCLVMVARALFLGAAELTLADLALPCLVRSDSELAKLLQKHDDALGAPLLLVDGHKGVEPLLSTGRPDVLKINVDEAKALTGAATAEAAAQKLLYQPNALLGREGAILALTDGPAPAYLFCAGGANFVLEVPSIECVNAIGAGDVCAAVFLHELCARRGAGGVADVDAADAFAWGLAAACARCMHEKPTEFSREEVEAMRERVRVERVDRKAARSEEH